MSKPSPREIKSWAVDGVGEKTPFEGTGICVPLSCKSWVEVNFQTKFEPIRVHVAVRAAQKNFDALPRLALVPFHGRSGVVLVGKKSEHLPDLPQVIPIKNDVMGRSVLEWLEEESTRDPLEAPELILAPRNYPRISARKFLLEYGDLSTIEIEVRESDEALIAVFVSAMDKEIGPAGQIFQSLGMSVSLGAVNVLNFFFREQASRIIDKQPPMTL